MRMLFTRLFFKILTPKTNKNMSRSNISKLFTVPLLFLAIVTVNPAYAENLATKDLLQNAKDLIDSWSGNEKVLTQAKSKLDQILKIDPDNPEALKEIARYYLKSGYINSVKRAAIGGGPYTVMTVTPGTFESAEAALKKALTKNPNFAEGYVLLGYVYYCQRQIEMSAFLQSRNVRFTLFAPCYKVAHRTSLGGLPVGMFLQG